MTRSPRPRPRGRAAPPDETYRVRLREPGDLAAALPHLLGFQPRESVVAVGLTGPTTDRVGLTVRVDIPPPAAARELARVVLRSLLTDDPGAVLLAVVSDADEPDAD
ncbi:DUF4192 domain-containing protein, partial [Geodermatophilus sp. YIM 151500]|uniref:DUF4192 domain-containing protein n=1 Tax=Geodermatophilus sp. YIM 151500 TaxID=2984531 RepID=UPI0021E46DCE